MLWNTAEQKETRKNSQTARSIDAALPREISREEQIDLVRKFVVHNFTSRGMCADFAIHDKGDGNPHVHILLTLRALDENGNWMPKCRKEYDLDENGEKICSIPKNVWTERKRIDVIVNNSHLVVDGKAVLTLSINAVNHSLLVGTPIFINGIQRATILNEDSRGNGYYIKHLLVPRDLQHEFYQIAVGWNSDATVELPVSELFNEE